jgi:nucleoid-associated protein YgaU
MIDRKTIAIIVALGVGLLASAGVFYLYSQGALPRFETAKQTPSGPVLPPQPQTSSPETAAQPGPSPAPTPAPKEQAVQPSPPAEPTAVPTFDVVVIEPSGEGVIAGRAAPGWQVSVKSGDTKVAAATSDEQGEWSAVLDKPLAAGEHALSLTITSPDGTRALSSQERVRVEVGATTKPGAAPETAAPSASSQVEAPSVSPKAEQGSLQTAAPPGPAQVEATAVSPKTEPGSAPPMEMQDVAVAEPRATARAVPPGTEASAPVPQAPKLVFKTVDYQDKGTSAGSVSITGTSDPGATIKVYSGDELIATVRADRDGSWSVVADKTLPTGKHNFRAERIDAATGAPSAKATVAIERLVPKLPEVAAAETKGTVAAARETASDSALRSKDVYTVQRGDTLWAIAKRYFGSGLRYPTIFQDNREIINDPNLIHPQQEVKVPPD